MLMEISCNIDGKRDQFLKYASQVKCAEDWVSLSPMQANEHYQDWRSENPTLANNLNAMSQALQKLDPAKAAQIAKASRNIYQTQGPERAYQYVYRQYRSRIPNPNANYAPLGYVPSYAKRQQNGRATSATTPSSSSSMSAGDTASAVDAPSIGVPTTSQLGATASGNVNEPKQALPRPPSPEQEFTYTEATSTMPEHKFTFTGPSSPITRTGSNTPQQASVPASSTPDIGGYTNARGRYVPTQYELSQGAGQTRNVERNTIGRRLNTMLGNAANVASSTWNNISDRLSNRSSATPDIGGYVKPNGYYAPTDYELARGAGQVFGDRLNTMGQGLNAALGATSNAVSKTLSSIRSRFPSIGNIVNESQRQREEQQRLQADNARGTAQSIRRGLNSATGATSNYPSGLLNPVTSQPRTGSYNSMYPAAPTLPPADLVDETFRAQEEASRLAADNNRATQLRKPSRNASNRQLLNLPALYYDTSPVKLSPEERTAPIVKYNGPISSWRGDQPPVQSPQMPEDPAKDRRAMYRGWNKSISSGMRFTRPDGMTMNILSPGGPRRYWAALNRKLDKELTYGPAPAYSERIDSTRGPRGLQVPYETVNGAYYDTRGIEYPASERSKPMAERVPLSEKVTSTSVRNQNDDGAVVTTGNGTSYDVPDYSVGMHGR